MSRGKISIEATLRPSAVEQLGRPRGLAALVPWLQVRPPTHVLWKKFELPVTNFPPGLQGLRIIQLSDFHFRRAWPHSCDAVVRRIREDPPDLLLFTGDFVDNKRNPYPALPTVRRLLDEIGSPCPRFAIVGNHDDYTVAYELRDTGITFLDGRRQIVPIKGAEVELIGLPGAHRLELEGAFLRRLPPKRAGVPRIVLSHFPDHLRRTQALAANLMLAGHTHGGQMCLPGGIPLLWHDSLPRRLAQGVHRVNGTWLIVSRGLGYTSLPFRVFCAPDVVELKICNRAN